MFKQFKSMDEAFQHTRRLSLVTVALSAVISIWAVYSGYAHAARAQERVYILTNGRAFEAKASDKRDNMEVECRGHIRRFHELVFNLTPDGKVIEANMHRAYYLADGSVRRFYDNLRESGYISGIISGNVTQSVSIDSIWVSSGDEPYVFRCWAKEKLVRSTTITERNLETHGFLREIQRSDDNEHGLLIERFEVLENNDIRTKNR
jgi:conjugative transposon TraK protein